MSTISNDRKNQLEQLQNFIENAKIKLSSIVSSLGWSIESVSKDGDNFVECPFNKSHRIPEKTLEKHLEECQWKAEGYRRKDLPLSVPSLPPGAPSSITFDEELQDFVIQNAKHKNPTMSLGASGRLIPRTSDRLVADFTREERCAMYEYVIKNTIQPDIGEDIADMNKPKTPGEGNKSSYLELLAQERNLKRRRAKYRGVHTNKKSQVEILREIISQQMEMLGEYISEKKYDSTLRISSFGENSHEKKNGKMPDFDEPMRNNYSRMEKNHSIDTERKIERSESRSSKSRGRSKDRGFRGNSSKVRSFDRDNNYSRGREDRDRGKSGSKKKKKRSRERSREDSRDRKSRKSSKKRRESKDRHRRRRSGDRDEFRSSRDSKNEDRKTKKRRS